MVVENLGKQLAGLGFLLQRSSSINFNLRYLRPAQSTPLLTDREQISCSRFLFHTKTTVETFQTVWRTQEPEGHLFLETSYAGNLL